MLDKVIKVKLVKEEYVDKNLPKGWKPYYIYAMIVDDKVVGKNVIMMVILDIRLKKNIKDMVMLFKLHNY